MYSSGLSRYFAPMASVRPRGSVAKCFDGASSSASAGQSSAGAKALCRSVPVRICTRRSVSLVDASVLCAAQDLHTHMCTQEYLSVSERKRAKQSEHETRKKMKKEDLRSAHVGLLINAKASTPVTEESSSASRSEPLFAVGQTDGFI